MLKYFCKDESAKTVIITPVAKSQLTKYLQDKPTPIKNWVNSTQFDAEPGSTCYLSGTDGQLTEVLFGVKFDTDFWAFACLAGKLPEGIYRIDPSWTGQPLSEIALSWGLACYQFEKYKKSTKSFASLYVADLDGIDEIDELIQSTYWVRDLINTPTEDLGPEQLANEAMALSKSFKAEFKEIVGDKLLKENYPAIHAVGRASDQAPRLIDIKWGDRNKPKITLVGKGVCFDTGGLNLKNAAGMILMKKDMGGAANVLGLARMIMSQNLPVCLRVLIPAVENAVSSNAYRPGDVIKTRKGLTVEIGNTDAEGRVVLADALTAAASDNPDLIIDFATLTGASRIALGTDIPSMFCNDDLVAAQIYETSLEQNDMVWRMPLYEGYREQVKSKIADLQNAPGGYAGAITAALFLEAFLDQPNPAPWVHFDLMAWNKSARPGRPEGGEASALRTMYQFIKQNF